MVDNNYLIEHTHICVTIKYVVKCFDIIQIWRV